MHLQFNNFLLKTGLSKVSCLIYSKLNYFPKSFIFVREEPIKAPLEEVLQDFDDYPVVIEPYYCLLLTYHLNRVFQ